MTQAELWKKVNEIKLDVRNNIGTDLSHEFKSSQVYQAYTGLCGEAQMAYEDEALDDELLRVLDEYAKKVIESYSRQPA